MAKKQKKKKQAFNWRRNWPFLLIFFIGGLIMAYPLISNIYYRTETQDIVSTFDEDKRKLDAAEIEHRMALAKAYNASLHNSVADPYNDEQKKAGREAYAHMIELRERIGHVEVPKIHQDLPIYAGTSEEVLQEGIGHLEGTSLPIGGISTHTVLTGHAGLPKAKLFTDLKKLKIGDHFYIHNFAETLAYEVDNIEVVLPTDFEHLMIVPNEDRATLLTCTPYMINTHRLFVQGHRIPYVPEVEKAEKAGPWAWLLDYWYVWLVLLVVIVGLVCYLWRRRKKKREVEVGGSGEKAED